MAGEANNVTLSTNFNVAPYYDDFNESKNFHRILFRPGLAVQARELTQMQTILQNQIDRFAEHIFQEGSTVKGLESNYDIFYSYLKLRNNNITGNTVTVSDFSDKIIKGTTSGVLAKVVKVNDGSEANTPNFKTLFVKYLAANTTTGYKFFANNEVVSTVGGGTVYSANSITSAQGGATGYGSAIKFNAGVVYAKDHFIRIPEQTVVVSKYDSTGASGRVGFDITETIVTETSDDTLLDPASGSYNYAAPGAARLKLTADLVSVPLTATVSNTFVELFQIKGGIVQSLSNRPQYARIRDYIAQRTYDESGDYVVNGFELNVKEHLKVGNNQGVLTSAEGGNTQQLVVFAEPGKAYVRGYDIERVASSAAAIDKAIDYESVESAKALVDYGNYVIVDNVVGNWDVNRQSVVSLRSQQANAVSSSNYSSTNFPTGQLGTARVRGIEHYTGTPGLPSAQYKLYLTDVTMASGYSFANVQSICYNGGVGTVYGKADIIQSNGKNANTKDPLFDRAVFRLPANAIKRLRDGSGNVDNEYSFYKSFDITFDGTGQATIATGDASETFDGSGVLSDAATRTDFYVIARAAGNTTTFSETLTTTSGSNTVTASATIDGKVNPGDIINIHTGGGSFVVSSVSGTTINLFGNASASGAGKAFHKRFVAGQVLDFGGVGKDGNRSITISPATTALLDLNETLNSTSLDATAIVTLNKIDGQEQLKTVQRSRLVQIRVGAGGGTSYTANTTGPWSLGTSDGFKLIEVRKKSGSNFSSLTEGTDVTSHFTLDSGMLDSYYSHARLVKKSSSALTIASGDRLLVKFDYFTHGTASRGFFAYDSYPVDDVAASNTAGPNIYTYEIPVFVSPSTGLSYDLRDCVDFRPRMTDTANAVTTLTNISINPKTSNTFVLPSGGLHFSPPGQDFTTDLEYYLRRVDIIGLNTDGRLVVTRGIPSVKAVPPAVPNDVMSMGSIQLAPYPSLPPVIGRRVGRPDLSNKFRKFNNRRYTMRDIGKIAERIDRLEYYTSLSLLEKSAQDLLVQDANGLDRFKNGILVDSFTTHEVGNVFDADYKIAVDPSSGEIRPKFTNDETPLVMTANSSHVVRTNVTPAGVSRDQIITLTAAPTSATFKAGSTVTSGSYTATVRHKVGTKLYVENATGNFAAAASITSSDGGTGAAARTISSVKSTTPGKLVTLPYTHKVLVQQPYATTTRNCVGTFYNYRGYLQLIPDNDYWCDTVQGPDTNITLDLNTDAWEYLAESWQATWNAPVTTFTGQPVFTGSNTTDVGSTYEVELPDGSVNIIQNTETKSIYATPTLTTQTGVKDGVKVVTSSVSYGNIVKDTSIVPFMRSRQVLFTVYGMMPSSRLYGFFDDVKVDSYITPLTEAEFTSGLKSVTGAPVKPAAAEGTALTTDANGKAWGVFRIPNDASLKFKTGSKRLRLVDNPTNSGVFGQYTTSAEATYTAEGLSQTVSALTVTTKSVEIAQTLLSKTTEGTSYSETTSSGTRVVGNYIPGDAAPVEPPQVNCGSDPIAQTMFIAGKLLTKVSSSGLYLTKVDLFFSTKDSTLPITIELREVDPLTSQITNRVVPFSRVVMESADINTSDDGSAATPVYFPSPVYLSNEMEYAIVLIPAATNPNYNAYTAVLGGRDILTDATVSEQPASGFLFTSANQRTWVPEEAEDLKFTAYYAEFDKDTVGSLILKNPSRDHLTIANTTGALSRIGEVVHGETRIVGTFTIAAGNTTAINTHVANNSAYAQGITSGATAKIVKYSSTALVLRDVSTNAKFRGGENIRIRVANTISRNATTGEIKGTGTATSATYPVGRVTYYDPVNYANTRLVLANTSYINSGAAFANARIFIANTYIKGQTNGYNARIVTINNLTIDNFNLITNMIVPSNNEVRAYAKMATSTSARDASFFRVNINGDTELRAPRYVLSRSVESNTAASSATMVTDRSIEVKYEFDSENIIASPALDLDRVSLYHTHNLISSNAAIGSSEDYVKNGGSSESRYITRIVTLADGQDAEDLRVYLTAYKPSGSNIHVYYKVLSADDNDTMADSRWIPMELNQDQGFTSSTRYSSSENKNDFLEFVYDVPAYTNTARSGANNATGVIEYRNSARARYTKFKYFQIKIVLTNSTSSNPPRVTDMRALALLI